MEKFLAVLKLVVMVTPTLIDAIKTVERAMPEKGNGASKLALVRSMLEGVYESIGALSLSFDEVWPALKKVVDATVATFNASGLFKK